MRVPSVSARVFKQAHCQTTSTRQPSEINSSYSRRSRSLFVSSFRVQNSTFVSGTVAFLQSACACQKHPLTKTTVFHFGRTISGLPGKSDRLSLYRNPRSNKRCLTKISGFVPFERIRDITSERFARENLSIRDSVSAGRRTDRLSYKAREPSPARSRSRHPALSRAPNTFPF